MVKWAITSTQQCLLLRNLASIAFGMLEIEHKLQVFFSFQCLSLFDLKRETVIQDVGQRRGEGEENTGFLK